MSKNELDLTKPMRCRSGCEARILCTDGPGDQPIVGFVEGKLLTWHINGSYWDSEERDPDDLINVPERRTAWVYELHSSASDHTYFCLSETRVDALDRDCLSRIRVEFEAGRMDE